MNDIVIYYVVLGPIVGVTLLTIGLIQHIAVRLSSNNKNIRVKNSSCFDKTWFMIAWALSLLVPVANLVIIGMTVRLIAKQKGAHAE